MWKFVTPLLIVVGACSKKQETATGSFIDSKGVEYATTFHFSDNSRNKSLVITEPWPGAKNPKRYPLGKQLKRIVCMSTSHLPYFEMLGLQDRVVGFPNTSYISSKAFLEKANDGSLVDVGSGDDINIEVLLSLNPDAVIGYDTGGESAVLNKIEEAGITVIFNADFLEKTPLGRAEYIKFFGALLDRQAVADSIFQTIVSSYDSLQKLARKVEERPSVLSGIVYGDIWFTPGGKNWSATFFGDAGGRYVWEADSSSGWLSLSFESVYDLANDADCWIGVSTIGSKEEIVALDQRYADFEPFAKDRIYNYDKRTGPNGGVDYFESGYARPDLILADLIRILHPQLLPDYETVYFQKLK